MVFLEDLIIDKLKMNLPTNVYVLGNPPLEPSNPKGLSLQPTPAVHVFEKSFQVLDDEYFLIHQQENLIKLKKNKQVWIVVVVKNAYDLQNPEYAFKELERLKCLIQKTLTYWNPKETPFTVPMDWDSAPVENIYETAIGFVFCPMILKTAKPYYETIRRI